MSIQIPSSITSMLPSIPKLNATNWFDWSKHMKMFFLGAGITGISSGNPPTEVKEKERWDALDRMLTAYIYMKVEDEYQYLIEDLVSGKEAWNALKKHFEHSTMGHRMNARKEFYDIIHDPSKSIEFYIQSLTSAQKKLSSLGVTIEDKEFKDVLLMHLDPSFYSVRTTILAQKAEPTLDDIKSILTSSTAADEVTVKLEPQDAVLMARGRSLQMGNSGQEGKGLVDAKGYHWCDVTNGESCHRCGHTGHIAARCMFVMPDHVKNYIMHHRSPSPHISHRSHVAQSAPSTDPQVVEYAGSAFTLSHNSVSPISSGHYDTFVSSPPPSSSPVDFSSLSPRLL